MADRDYSVYPGIAPVERLLVRCATSAESRLLLPSVHASSQVPSPGIAMHGLERERPFHGQNYSKENRDG